MRSEDALVETKGANSVGETEVVEDHQPIQEASDFAARGLLRIEERLWIPASESDLVSGEDEEDWESLENLPDWEGCRSIFQAPEIMKRNGKPRVGNSEETRNSCLEWIEIEIENRKKEICNPKGKTFQFYH